MLCFTFLVDLRHFMKKQLSYYFRTVSHAFLASSLLLSLFVQGFQHEQATKWHTEQTQQESTTNNSEEDENAPKASFHELNLAKIAQNVTAFQIAHQPYQAVPFVAKFSFVNQFFFSEDVLLIALRPLYEVIFIHYTAPNAP